MEDQVDLPPPSSSSGQPQHGSMEMMSSASPHTATQTMPQPTHPAPPPPTNTLMGVHQALLSNSGLASGWQPTATTGSDTPTQLPSVELMDADILISSGLEHSRTRAANLEYQRLLLVNCVLFGSLPSHEQGVHAQHLYHLLTHVRGRRFLQCVAPNVYVPFLNGPFQIAQEITGDHCKTAYGRRIHPHWMLEGLVSQQQPHGEAQWAHRRIRNNNAESSEPEWELVPTLEQVKEILKEEQGPVNLILLPPGMELKSVVVAAEEHNNQNNAATDTGGQEEARGAEEPPQQPPPPQQPQEQVPASLTPHPHEGEGTTDGHEHHTEGQEAGHNPPQSETLDTREEVLTDLSEHPHEETILHTAEHAVVADAAQHHDHQGTVVGDSSDHQHQHHHPPYDHPHHHHPPNDESPPPPTDLHNHDEDAAGLEDSQQSKRAKHHHHHPEDGGGEII